MSISSYFTKSCPSMPLWRWDCPFCKKTYRGLLNRDSARMDEHAHRRGCRFRPELLIADRIKSMMDFQDVDHVRVPLSMKEARMVMKLLRAAR